MHKAWYLGLCKLYVYMGFFFMVYSEDFPNLYDILLVSVPNHTTENKVKVRGQLEINML